MCPNTMRVLLAVSCLLVAEMGRAEAQVRVESAGLRTVLPIVPQQDPRRSEGSAPADQWRIQRSDADNLPVASFVDSLKGNDAAVQVVVGQGRILTTRRPIARSEGAAVIALGDPTIIDFEVLPDPRMIRILGKRAGITDLSITTDDKEIFNFEVHVGYDLELLSARLLQLFPDAMIKLGQIREHVVVEGQARSPEQVSLILEVLDAYVGSVQVPFETLGQQAGAGLGFGPSGRGPAVRPEDESAVAGRAVTAADDRPDVKGSFAESRIINLLRVPGVHQVLLQVRIAELNRTALRRIGADTLGADSHGNVYGSQIGGGTVAAGSFAGTLPGDMGVLMDQIQGLVGGAASALGSGTTAFGIFPGANFHVLLQALRDNSVINILAEPNLITMSGHEANFLAGGEFPVPVPQGGPGAGGNVTVEFKDFGVQLVFLPYVLDDGRIRLHVEPEVSTIDFSIGTTLVVGGDPIPGLNTRRAATTVEMREGQTLAIAGLLEVDLDAQTQRIPGLGDLPYIGQLFSNTSHQRVEKELLVLVTPHLVTAMNPDEVGPVPGEDITDPTDKEFYLLNRIEGRTCQEFNATTSWDRPHVRMLRMQHERSNGCGPIGYSE